MPQTNTKSKLSTWLFWAPLKFAITTFIALGIVGLLYTMIAGKIYAPAPIPYQPLLWFFAITFFACTCALFYKLPRTNIDRLSFIATHNIQMFIATIFFIALTYIVLNNANAIVLNLILLETKSQISVLAILSATAIVLLYLFGILFSNIYAKFMRIQTLTVPTWKIICSMPFGFSALWTPGYILPTATQETTAITQPKWYKKLNDKIISHQSSTIAVFTTITMLSGFIFGLNGVLLTFTLSLIFGIWTLQVGTKKFTQNIGSKYANWAIIVNVVLIITLTLFSRIYSNIHKVPQLNTTESEQTINN